MRMNFNWESSTVSNHPDPPWLQELMRRFAEHYDMDISRNAVFRLMWSPAGIKKFAEWIEKEGWKVSYWELDLPTNQDDPSPVAFGLDIADDCPKFMEAKLKCD